MPGTTELRAETDGPDAPTAGDVAGVIPAAALALALLALVVAPWLPWQTDVTGWGVLSDAQSSVGEVVAVWALGPTVLAWAAVLVQLAFDRRSALTMRLAEVVNLVGTGFLVFTVLEPPNDETAPGIGMGLAVFAFPAALVAGFVLDLMRENGTPRLSWTALITVVVLGVAIGFASVWFFSGRIVDATTTRAGTTAAQPGTDPAGTVVWSQSLVDDDPDGPAVTALADGWVALRTRPGKIVVRDLVTGTEQWHYARSGVAMGGMVASEDGRTLLVDFAARHRDLVVAFDSATGEVRWQRWQPETTSTFLLPTAVLTLYPDHVVAYGHQATADDPATGGQLWSQSLGQWCHQPAALAGVASTTVVLTPCHTDGRQASTSELGVRAIGRDGRIRWQHNVSRGLPVEETSVVLADPRVVAVRAPGDFAVYDPASGNLLFRTPDRPLASDSGHLLSSTNHGQVSIRDLTTGATRTVPVRGPVLAGDMHDGHAYVVVDTNDEGPLQLDGIDLATGAIDGMWSLPQRFTTLYHLASVKVSAGDGMVIVAGLTFGIESDLVAVRVP